MKIMTHISGSVCVAQITPQVYVDARHSRRDGYTDIEFVSHGRVRAYRHVSNDKAPYVIVDMLRNWRAM